MDVSPLLVEENVDSLTEFDWRDYNYGDGVPVPNHLDSDDEFCAWNMYVNRKKEETQKELTSSYISDSSTTSKSSRDRPGTPLPKIRRKRTPPRVHFKQNMDNIFHKHKANYRKKKAGILKNVDTYQKPEEETPSNYVSDDGSKDSCYVEKSTNVNMIDHDLSEAVVQFNKYISEKVVRFSKQKESKIKFLWSNLDVENKAQWEIEGTRRHVNDKKYPKDDETFRKGEIHLPLIKFSPNLKSIRDFEKRNVTRTISKLSTLESLFIKRKQLTPDSSVASYGELDEEADDENDTVPVRKPKNFDRTNRRGSLRGDPGEAITTHHGVRLRRAIRKVQKLLTAERGAKLRKSIRSLIDERRAVESPTQKSTPLERFYHAGRLIVLLLRAVGIKPEKPEDNDYNFLSWTILYDELGISRTPYDHSGLMFDPQKFKASKESFLSNDVQEILLKKPSERTDAQIQQVIRFVSQVVPAFGEYPMRIQWSTLKCCTLERFEAGRVIIRQGHSAENFYFIISGTAVVTIMESGANHVHTVNSLTSGNSFGELAFLNMSKRTATVTCRENMELLCIEREDFIEIFMRKIKGQEPEHMAFLRNVDLFVGWPIDKLPQDNLRICAFTYVRRGIILSADSTKSDWLFVVVSGTCKILKSLLDSDASKEKNNNHRTIFHMPTYIQRGAESKKDRDNSENTGTYLRKKHSKKQKLLEQPSIKLPSAIEKIVNRSIEEVRSSEKEHLSQLDTIYKKRHALPSINGQDRNNKRHGTNGQDDNGNSEIENGDGNGKQAQNRAIKKHGRTQHHVIFASPTQMKPSSPSHFMRGSSQNFGILKSPRHSAARRKRVVVSPASNTSDRASTPVPQVKKVFIEVARLEPGDVFGLEQVVMIGRDDVTSTSLVSDGAEIIIIDKKFFKKHLTEETAKRIRKLIRPVPSETVLQQNLLNQKSWDYYKTKTLEKQTQLMKIKANVAFRA